MLTSVRRYAPGRLSLRWWLRPSIGGGVPVVVGLFIASACHGPDSPCDCFYLYQAVAAGNNNAHKNPADTAVRASYGITGRDTASWKYTASALSPLPHGTIIFVRLLQGTVKGTLCTGGGCGAAVTTPTKITGVTDAYLTTAMRNVEVRVIVYTDSDPAGAASGAITLVAP